MKGLHWLWFYICNDKSKHNICYSRFVETKRGKREKDWFIAVFTECLFVFMSVSFSHSGLEFLWSELYVWSSFAIKFYGDKWLPINWTTDQFLKRFLPDMGQTNAIIKLILPKTLTKRGKHKEKLSLQNYNRERLLN